MDVGLTFIFQLIVLGTRRDGWMGVFLIGSSTGDKNVHVKNVSRQYFSSIKIILMFMNYRVVAVLVKPRQKITIKRR